MKIVHSSAYVQTETFTFTFAQQAIIVYFIFVPTFKKSLCRRTNINVQGAAKNTPYKNLMIYRVI